MANFLFPIAFFVAILTSLASSQSSNVFSDLSRCQGAIGDCSGDTGIHHYDNNTAPCDSPLFCYGSMLQAIQMTHLYNDSKKFVDMCVLPQQTRRGKPC